MAAMAPVVGAAVVAVVVSSWTRRTSSTMAPATCKNRGQSSSPSQSAEWNERAAASNSVSSDTESPVRSIRLDAGDDRVE